MYNIKLCARALSMCFIIQYCSARVLHDYSKERNLLWQKEIDESLGGKLVLSDDENIANDILMHWKHKETDEFFSKPQNFNFSTHFFTYKKHMEKSKVYQIIRQIPKGAALHVHSSFMLDAKTTVNLTYEDHLYMCVTDGDLKFHFSDSMPTLHCDTNWALLSDLRSISGDVAAFDAQLSNHFTMYTEDPKIFNGNINQIWERFNEVYHVIKSLISYRPLREKFFYESLRKFYEDNVMYVEIRSGLHKLYELNGTIHDGMYLARLYKRVTEKFIEDHPGFIGVKLILTGKRASDVDTVEHQLDLARKLKSEMPEMFAGFDLVGQEDLGKPLDQYLPALLDAKNDLEYYFHAGETNWFGKSSDENLFDAILLGSKRIGHGYALPKHPSLLADVKSRDIAVEVNVISNVVLALVRDVRNHPLATFLARDVPVVLSSDDPGVWGADPLSHDFYVAFVIIASNHADLRMLKQLALNSIKYSTLDHKCKTNFYNVFNEKWNRFIKDVIATKV